MKDNNCMDYLFRVFRNPFPNIIFDRTTTREIEKKNIKSLKSKNSYSCTEGHKRKERNDVKTSSNLHLFFGNSSKDFKNVAGELTLVFHTVKHNIGYRSMDCANKFVGCGYSRTPTLHCNKCSCITDKMSLKRAGLLAPKRAVFVVGVSFAAARRLRAGDAGESPYSGGDW
jgi:hypothetical protein